MALVITPEGGLKSNFALICISVVRCGTVPLSTTDCNVSASPSGGVYEKTQVLLS